MSWIIDSSHTRVAFSARHMMITSVHGVFEKVSGTVDFNEANPERSAVEVQIEAASINTHDQNRDNHLRSADFFDAGTYPYLTFKSTRIEKLSKDHGPYLANRVMRHVRAAWNTALKEHDLPANPTIAVHWNKEHRRQEPIAWAKLPAWLETVVTLEPIIVDGKRVGARPGARRA
jgi:hypothetical protein